MKPNSKRQFYWIVAVVSLVYGGIALILFFQQFLFVLQRPEQGQLAFRNVTAQRPHPDRFNPLFAFPMPITLLGSVVAILAGVSMINLLRSREKKELAKELIDSVILPDEKLVIVELEKNNGELTQSEIVSKTKLSKVKVHRIVKRLESMDIIKKYPYGMTNKIKLQKTFSLSDS